MTPMLPGPPHAVLKLLGFCHLPSPLGRCCHIGVEVSRADADCPANPHHLELSGGNQAPDCPGTDLQLGGDFGHCHQLVGIMGVGWEMFHREFSLGATNRTSSGGQVDGFVSEPGSFSGEAALISSAATCLASSRTNAINAGLDPCSTFPVEGSGCCPAEAGLLAWRFIYH